MSSAVGASVPRLGGCTHKRLSRRADLVEPFCAAHDPRALHARDSERFGKDRTEVARVDADDDRLGFRRVDQRAEGVEDGREAELFPDGGDADHGGVVDRGKEEEEGGLGRDLGEGRGGEGRDGATEGEKDVGRAGRRGRRLVTVL